MMNKVKKAKIFRAILEEGYTCMISFYVLKEDGRTDIIQGFGGKKFHTHEDYSKWKNGIENIIDRRFEDIKGAVIKVVVTPIEEDILAIGNLNGNYWITKEKNGKETEFNFITNKEKIDDYFERNNIEHKIKKTEKDGIER